MRWAILGTGRMARAFAAALPHASDAEVIVIGSRSAENSRAFAREHSVRHASGSYEGALDTPGLEAVYIALPHSLHHEWALAALRRGLPVLCEKPFALNAIQAQAMIDAARAGNAFLMEAMWTRFLPLVTRLRREIAEGCIGTPQLLVAGGAFVPDYDPDFYLFNRELGGGVLLDAGVYLVSLASMLFGAPGRICALGSIGRHGVDEHEAVILEHASGALASLYVSLRARKAPDFSIIGSEGCVQVSPPLFCPRRMTIEVSGAAPRVIEEDFPGNGYQFQIEEVQRCVGAGQTESSIMPAAETLQIMRTMDEIRRQLGLKYPGEQNT